MVAPAYAPTPTTPAPDAGTPEAAAASTGITRVDDKTEYDPAQCALVTDWLSRMDEGEAYWKDAFKQMKENSEFATKGADPKWVKDKCYRVPILNRHINQSVAKLYARNPKATATRRRQMLFTLWDGRQDSLNAAMEMAATTGDPNAMALIQEVLAALKQDLMLDRMGKTLEILWEYYLSEQSSNYKKQIKSMVRRTKVKGVSYVKLVFQRALQQQPEITAKIEDTTSKLNEIQRLLTEQEGGEMEETSADAFKLKTLLADLQDQEYIVTREGPVLDFPASDAVIIDPEVVNIATLTGAGWIAFPYDKTEAEIEKIYKLKLGNDFKDYVQPNGSTGPAKEPLSARSGKTPRKAKKVRIYEIWDKDSQQKLVVMRGYDQFLEVPAAPKPQLSRFWPLFPLVMNEVEHDEIKIPPSDIEQSRDIQMEYNRSRESLRQHRIAARPYYVENGKLTKADKEKLGQHLDHEVLTLTAMAPGDDISKVVQRGPTAPIDPNLYEVEIHFKDLQRVVGASEANFGGAGTSGTATGDSIAENSQSVQTTDNIDDLDELLTDLSVAAGEMMLMELSKPVVVEIVGPGAVWPDHPESRQDAAKHLFLKIEAGSSGRPNQAAELAKLERATPMLLQLPNFNSAPVAKRYAELFDFDMDSIIAEGMPSITAINAMLAKTAAPAMSQAGADPTAAPAMQGPAGGGNAPVPAARPPGGQPGFPAPMPVNAH